MNFTPPDSSRTLVGRLTSPVNPINAGLIELLKDREHTIQVTGIGDATATYAFMLWCAGPAVLALRSIARNAFPFSLLCEPSAGAAGTMAETRVVQGTGSLDGGSERWVGSTRVIWAV